MSKTQAKVAALMAFLLAATLAAFSQQSKAAPSNAVAKADRAFCESTRQKGLEGWVEWFSDKAALPQFEPPLIGKEGIRRGYEGFFARKNLDFRWEPDEAEILPQGNIGYTSGHYTQSWDDAAGKRQQRSGNYVTVWEKQKDGGWKVIGDFGSANPPPKVEK